MVKNVIGQKVKSISSGLSSVMEICLDTKTFLVSLTALILLSIIGITAITLTSSPGPVTPHISGKAMATITVAVTPPPPEESLPPPTVPQTVTDVHTGPLESADTENLEPPGTLAESQQPATDPPKSVEDSIAGLYETTPYGPLPVIRKSDEAKVFDAYKAPFVLGGTTKAVISIIMVDYGLSDNISRLAIEKLPPFTTLIASPFSSGLQAKVTAARTKDFEVWMALPIQSTNMETRDTGPTSILSSLDAKTNITRLETNLGRATGYAGVSFLNTPDFPETSPELQKVIESITGRGLGIAQMDATDSIIGKICSTIPSAPCIQNTVWLDKSVNKDAIMAALENLKSTAIDKGYAVAAFHPSPAMLDILSKWQASLGQSHIQLAPLTYAIHQQTLSSKK